MPVPNSHVAFSPKNNLQELQCHQKIFLTVCYHHVTYAFQSESRPVWLNEWVFVYELNGCRFQSPCCQLIFFFEFWYMSRVCVKKCVHNFQKNFLVFIVFLFNYFFKNTLWLALTKKLKSTLKFIIWLNCGHTFLEYCITLLWWTFQSIINFWLWAGQS